MLRLLLLLLHVLRHPPYHRRPHHRHTVRVDGIAESQLDEHVLPVMRVEIGRVGRHRRRVSVVPHPTHPVPDPIAVAVVVMITTAQVAVAAHVSGTRYRPGTGVVDRVHDAPGRALRHWAASLHRVVCVLDVLLRYDGRSRVRRKVRRRWEMEVGMRVYMSVRGLFLHPRTLRRVHLNRGRLYRSRTLRVKKRQVS